MILRLLFMLLVGYPAYALSFLFPRTPKKWVFGSNNGFGCNAKYLFAQILDSKETGVEAIWIARDRQTLAQLRGLGLQQHVVYLKSLLGFYHLLTAGVYVTTHDLHRSLSVWTIGRAKWVNLWHGVGIKALRFKSETSYLKRVYECRLLRMLTYPALLHLNYRPDMFLCTSALMKQHFMACFDLPEKAMVLGPYPRCALLNADRTRRDWFADRYEPQVTRDLIATLREFDKVYIYVPTWRKTNGQFDTELNLDLGALHELMASVNGMMLIKLHPYVQTADIVINVTGNRIRFLPGDMDLYALLPETDVLITDYSSVYYDYALIHGKGIILYPFDYEQYLAETRDLAFDYEAYMPGVRAYSFDKLCTLIRQDIHTPTDSPEIEPIKGLFWADEAMTTDLIKTIKAL